MIEQPPPPLSHNFPAKETVSALSGKWLKVARLGWILLALAAVGILLASLPGYAQKLGGQLDHISSDTQSVSNAIIAALSGLTSLASALLSITLATIFFRRRFNEPMAAAVAFYLLLYGVIMAGPLETGSAYWQLNNLLALKMQGALIAVPSVALFALFPNGRFVPAWTRWLLLLTFPWSVAFFLLPSFNSALLSGPAATILLLLTVGLIVFFATGLVAQFYRYRYVSTLTEQQQTKWVLFGFVLWLSYILLSSIPYFYLTNLPADAPTPWWGPVSVLGWFLSLNFVPVSLTIAVTRYRLWDIDIIINRTLVYGALTAVGVGLYALVVGGTSVLFQQQSNLAAGLVTAVLAIALFKPLRSFLQRSVNRVVKVGEERPFPDDISSIIHSTKRVASVTESAPFQLTGRWLLLARFVWMALALIVAVLTVWAIILQQVPLADTPFLVLMPAGHFIIAVIIFWRKPNDGMALLTSLMLIFLGPYLLAGTNGIIEFQSGWRFANRLLVGIGFSAFILFLALFPDGRFAPRRLRPWVYLTIATNFASVLFTPGDYYSDFWIAILIISTLAGVLVQIYRYRYVSSAIQRQQTKWIVVGSAGPVLNMAIWFLLILPGIFPLPSEPLNRFLYLVFAASLSLILPLSLAFSILRYRLWHIDVIINRALVYGALTACVVAVYALVVGAMGTLFQAQGNWLIALIATGLVAVLFQPLRARWQQWVNQLLYGRRDEPFEVLASLGQRLENSMSPEAVFPTIVETVAQTLKLPYVALAVKKGNLQETAASFGKPTATPEAFPLTYQGVEIGQLLAARRSPDEPFTDGEERLLRNMARQAGTAVHAHQLTADLQRARQQIVTSREEERRRLRRDLHDGLGPTLASHMLKIGSARALLNERPETTDKLLSEMEADLENTLTEVRRIVYDLRPPALDQWGLVGALRAYAETCANGYHPALTIRVDAPDSLPPLPAAVEVAAYYIAREGLTNTVRHAQAEQCVVRLFLDDGEGMGGNGPHVSTGAGRLHLSIRDDGKGLSNAVQAGVGFVSMRERAEELGGSWLIESLAGGGVTVTAVLPLGEG